MPSSDRTAAVGGRRVRYAAATLLAVEALLVAGPALVVSHVAVGGAIMGKGLVRVRSAEVVLQGVVWALVPLLVLLLLLAAWGLAHSTRGVGALLLQPLVAASGSVPLLRASSPLSGLERGWLVAVGVAAVTTVLLLVVAARPRPAPGAHRRWWWLVGYAATLAAVAVAGARTTSVPSDPWALLLDPGSGEAPPTRPVDEPLPPQNPGLAANPWSSIHHDAWGSDVYAIPGPSDPATAPVESLFTGGDCGTVTVDSRGRLVTLCATLTRVVAHVVDPQTLQVLARQVVGSRRPSLTDFSGGGYFVLDAQDRIVVPAEGTTLTVLSTDGDPPRVEPVLEVDLAGTLVDGERVTSVLPDWQGRYWYVGSRGTVGLVGEDGRVMAVNLDGESIENSFALAEDGVYVVTGAAMYRLWVDDSGVPQVVWRTPYDTGTQRKPGQTSRASGTTPTLLADGRLVAIADNAEPRMNVLVLDTERGEVRCTQPVFAPGASGTENALVAAGSMLVVENNHGYAPPIAATTGGRSTQPGLAAIDVDPTTGACRTRWENNEIHVPSVVSKATLAQDLVLTYTKPPHLLGVDGWYLTAVHLGSGEVAWTRLAGTGVPFNNHYAAAYLGPGGDLYVGILGGLVVLRNTAA